MLDTAKRALGLVFAKEDINKALSVIVFGLALLALMTFANLALWLLSGLWITAGGEAFGVWVFWLALLAAISGAAAIAWRFWRQLEGAVKVEVTAPTAAQTYQAELEQKVQQNARVISSEEQQRWRAVSSESLEAQKSKALAAVTKAGESLSEADLHAADALLDEIAAAHPGAQDWVDDLRDDIGEMRRRL